MIRRHVTTFGEFLHVVEYDLSCLEISRGRLGVGESSKRMRTLAHQLHTLFRSRDRFRMAAQLAQYEAAAVEHHQISRLVLEACSRKPIRFFKAACMIRTPEHREARDDCHRIEISAGVRFAQRLTEATFHRKLKRVPDTRRWIVWIELNRTNEMMLGTSPREVATKNGLAQRNVSFSKIRIEVNRRRSRFIRRRRTLGKRHHTENTKPVVIVRHARIRERVLRIERDRLLVANDRSRKAVFSKCVPVKTPAHISFVGLWTVGASFSESQTLIHRQVRYDSFGDVRRDDVFEIQNIGELFVKLSRPRGRFLAHVEQLDRHANTFCSASDSSVQNKRDAELTSGTQRIGVGAVTQHTARWSNCETANGAESRDQSISQTCSEVVRSSFRLVDVENLHRQNSQRVLLVGVGPHHEARMRWIG